MYFYIGIDSGATNCRFLIETVKAKTYEFSKRATHLPTAGAKSFAINLSNKLNSLLKKLHLTNDHCKGLCIGIAGARSKKLKKTVKEQIIKTTNIANVIVTSDTEIAHYGIYNDGEGLIFISGSGSILYGKINGEIQQAGGWGRIVGDAGSGYQIGQLALQKITDDFDTISNNKNVSFFTTTVCKITGFTPENLIELIYLKNFPVASLAEHIIKIADKGNKTAREILDCSIDSAMKYFDAILSRIPKKTKKIKLALVGSLVESENYFSRSFKAKLKKNYPLFEIIQLLHQPVFGALEMAKKEFPYEES
ncbi:MAG: N-acetylglucosamine kinase [Ignavibacteria bacterium]